MRKIKMPKDTVLTTELIQELISDHVFERNRIIKMKSYYNGLNYKIRHRPYKDVNKPSNRLYSGYASYITDNFVGYLLGQPITYKSDNEELLEKLNDNFLYNDEVDNNTTLAQEQSICGYAYELLYRDEEANARFRCINTEEAIVVYENDLEEKEMFAIRYVKVNTTKLDDRYIVYVYDKEYEYVYEMRNHCLGRLIETNNHFFDDVPICTYENNRQRIGDFEKVLSLIDAYDLTNSDTANDFEYFTNALLVVSGIVMEEDSDQPLNFRDNRVLNFADTNSKAEYLIKNINDTALENYKNRLNRDILRFSNCVDMSDENFGSNLSGVSLKFKLNGMENITSIKESKFRKGLMKRIELLVSFLGIKHDSDYTYTEIAPVFVRNVPSNDVETIETVKGLVGTNLVSMDTLRLQIPFVEDLLKEKEAIEKEKEDLYDSYEFDNEEANTDNEDIQKDEQLSELIENE